MAYKKSVRLNLRCPKHIRYNPENGHGAIKGGCFLCEEIWGVYEKVTMLEHSIATVTDGLNRYIECVNMKKEGKVSG